METELGCVLFVRKTRAIELTTAGQSLYSAVREGFDTIAAGVDRLRQQARPTVRIPTTPAFAAKWLVPRLASFQALHPPMRATRSPAASIVETWLLERAAT